MFKIKNLVGHEFIPGRVCVIFPCEDNTHSDGRCCADVQTSTIDGVKEHHVVAAFPCREHVQTYLRLTP